MKLYTNAVRTDQMIIAKGSFCSKNEGEKSNETAITSQLQNEEIVEGCTFVNNAHNDQMSEVQQSRGKLQTTKPIAVFNYNKYKIRDNKCDQLISILVYKNP